MNKGMHFIWSMAIALGLTASSSYGVEPWADKKLGVTNGLEVWLDASRELAARAQGKRGSKLMNGGALDCWHDASGNHRDVSQPVPDARPHLQQITSHTAT